jgi:excisionase family DNA binding protein
MASNMEKPLSPEALAAFLGVPLGTVYQWNSRGGGPDRIKVGKHVRYRVADIEAWLDRRSTSAATAAGEAA